MPNQSGVSTTCGSIEVNPESGRCVESEDQRQLKLTAHQMLEGQCLRDIARSSIVEDSLNLNLVWNQNVYWWRNTGNDCVDFDHPVCPTQGLACSHCESSRWTTSFMDATRIFVVGDNELDRDSLSRRTTSAVRTNYQGTQACCENKVFRSDPSLTYSPELSFPRFLSNSNSVVELETIRHLGTKICEAPCGGW